MADLKSQFGELPHTTPVLNDPLSRGMHLSSRELALLRLSVCPRYHVDARVGARGWRAPYLPKNFAPVRCAALVTRSRRQ